MSKEDFRKEYERRVSNYDDLRSSLQDVLKRLLKIEGKLILDVTSRVKSIDSAYDKILKYEISNPFESIHDWCGLRIICYYYEDVDEIGKILEKEFDIVERRDKRESADANQFGYRSLHYILKVKESWAQTPVYRGLNGIKIEVQIRTILMHAWAEIEHKLQYKSIIGVPTELKRLLFRLSAKFEEADEQFETIRKGVAEYENKLRERATTIEDFKKEELNSNVLKSFIDLVFPHGGPSHIENVSRAIVGYLEAGLTMEDIIDSYKAGSGFVKLGEEEMSKLMHIPGARFGPEGSMQFMLEVACDKYRQYLTKRAQQEGHSIYWSREVIAVRQEFEKVAGKS
jgi:putative GTP pyrophosphokinase